MKKIWRLGELFCGPGGFAEGAQQAGFHHLWAVDHDPDSCISFGNNQKGTVYTMEIEEFVRKEHLKKLKKIDGLLFGFPCNDFSIVGKKKGLKGKFGGLYRHACAAIDYLKPKFFVAENVTSITSRIEESESYKNFKIIMSDLANCSKYGYRIYADNFKFEEHGVPQRRHRIILVGFRGDVFNKNNVSYQKPNKEDLITCEKALNNIPKWAEHQEKTNHAERVIRRLKKTAEGKNVWDLGDDADGLPGVTKARMSHIYKKLKRSEPSYTVTGSGGGGTHVYHYKENRALTNRERARLQTFPDDYNFYGGKESIRRQIGMAVPAEGAKKIMLAVKKALKKRKERIPYHHEWMIKAKDKDLYFTGKEDVDQNSFNFEE